MSKGLLGDNVVVLNTRNSVTTFVKVLQEGRVLQNLEAGEAERIDNILDRVVETETCQEGNQVIE